MRLTRLSPSCRVSVCGRKRKRKVERVLTGGRWLTVCRGRCDSSCSAWAKSELALHTTLIATTITTDQRLWARVSSIGYRDARRDLKIDIAVGDGSAAVPGVLVEITLFLDGSPLASGSATTGDDGTVTFKLRNPPSGSYTTAIDGLSKAGTFYDASLNAADPGHTR